MTIQEARNYLITVMSDRFTDRTFERYITHHLAGDFAVEIANTVECLDTEVEQLTADLTRVSAERDELRLVIAEYIEDRRADRVSMERLQSAYDAERGKLESVVAERDTWKARYLNKTLRFNAVRARAKVDMERLAAEIAELKQVVDGYASEKNSLVSALVQDTTASKGDTGRGE